MCGYSRNKHIQTGKFSIIHIMAEPALQLLGKNLLWCKLETKPLVCAYWCSRRQSFPSSGLKMTHMSSRLEKGILCVFEKHILGKVYRQECWQGHFLPDSNEETGNGDVLCFQDRGCLLIFFIQSQQLCMRVYQVQMETDCYQQEKKTVTLCNMSEHYIPLSNSKWQLRMLT